FTALRLRVRDNAPGVRRTGAGGRGKTHRRAMRPDERPRSRGSGQRSVRVGKVRGEPARLGCYPRRLSRRLALPRPARTAAAPPAVAAEDRKKTMTTVRPVSVVICTRNRAERLPKVIDLLRAQDYPQQAMEIVVVDNRSTDHTSQVVNQLAARAGVPLRYVYEARE